MTREGRLRVDYGLTYCTNAEAAHRGGLFVSIRPSLHESKPGAEAGAVQDLLWYSLLSPRHPTALVAKASKAQAEEGERGGRRRRIGGQ